ncbi:hypothetical protein [Viridibacillus arvi]|uniref:hypothetical protein n=1 Tax=Viridibacillus arvi TaxID=263475 RepID=UPI0034CDE18A
MGEDLIKWFFGLFVPEATVTKIASSVEVFMNYLVLGISVKWIVLVVLIIIAGGYIVSFRNTKQRMLKKVVDADTNVYSISLYDYKESDNGKEYEMRKTDLNTEKLPIGFKELGDTEVVIIDDATLVDLNRATEPYRVSKGKYNLLTAFGFLPFYGQIDTTELRGLLVRWRDEFRVMTLAQIQALSPVDQEKLRFKFMALTVSTNVLSSIGNDITILRSMKSKKPDVHFNNIKNVLHHTSDTPTEKIRLDAIQKELTSINSMLARIIVLNVYFQAYSAVSILSAVEFNKFTSDVTYMQLPVQLNNGGNTMAIVVLSPSFHRLPDKNDVLNNIRRTVAQHQRGIRYKNALSRLIRRK